MKWNVYRAKDNMNCYNCDNELIWGSDHDTEEENEDYIMETFLSCPTCNSFVIVYTPKEEI